MTHVTDSTIKELLNNNEFTVLDFAAQWCGPCKSLAPVLEKLEAEMTGKVAFGKVDIEECVDATDEYGIRSVPTLMFFKNGEMKKKIVGAVPEAKLRAAIDELMA
ncbi:MAG: thioredoxin [Paludibacteraceae bacterium]|nr:thioredoxin [Candidatus Colousia faecequi]MCQ2337645.1 thioredoxin [Paludibacteraceae bacterium]MCQ2343780.1 thioredoxin [Paludibacteraceae bacterium]